MSQHDYNMANQQNLNQVFHEHNQYVAKAFGTGWDEVLARAFGDLKQHLDQQNVPNPGITVQKPDGAMAVVGEPIKINRIEGYVEQSSFAVGEQLPDTPASWPPGLKWNGPLKFEVVELPPTPEPVHGGPYLLWADIESALSRLGMVPVARSWYHEARVLMNAQLSKPAPEPESFPANALRPLHGERWR